MWVIFGDLLRSFFGMIFGSEQEIEVHGHGGPRNLAPLFSSSGGGFVNVASFCLF